MASCGENIVSRDHQSRTRRLIACNFCRLKKVRCNGGHPCKNCADHGEVCESAPRQRPRLKKRDRTNSEMAQRLAQLESLLQSLNNSAPTTTPNALKSDSCNNTLGPTGQMRNNSPTLLRNTAPMSLGSVLQEGPFSDLDELTPPVSAHSTHSQDFANVSNFPSLDCDGNLAVNAFPSPCTNSSAPQANSSGFERSFTIASQPIRGEQSKLSGPLQEGISATDTELDQRHKTAMSRVNEPEEDRERNGVYFGELSNWEYHGPRSYLSICSKPGIQWVFSITGTETFQESAFRLTKEITQSLKIERHLPQEKAAEPTIEAAQRYVKAYFECASEASFGIVNRARFESRLQAHFQDSTDDDDPAWYALRNAIYACGARIELSKSGGFREACQTAWAYFANTLSVHTELLYFRTSLLAIQALAVMAYFTDSMGNPCLEYMLSTIALRLACSKGLHRRPASSWNISQYEQRHRDRLFWALYCLEKSACSRSGRPSMLNDEEISCEWPTAEPGDNVVNVTYCTILIRLAQMSSMVMRKLSNIDAFQQPPQVLTNTVAALDEENRRLEIFLRYYLSLDAPSVLPTSGAGLSVQEAIYIRLYYYNLKLDIHTALSNPWSRGALNLKDHPGSRLQMEKSVEIVAQTARNAILACQYIYIDAATPLLLSFYSPLYALVNLFIHVLERPNHPTIQSDLALMDIGAAHFSRVQFSTELSFPFAKDVASLARTAVRRHRDLPAQSLSAADTCNKILGVQEMPNTPGLTEVRVDHGRDDTEATSKDGDLPNLFDFELDNWSTFLPPPDFDDTSSDFLGQ